MSNVEKRDIDRFVDLINDGISKWVEAGEVLVAIMEKDNLTIADIADKTGLQCNVIAQFERIGRHEIHPKLLISDCAGYRWLSRMNISEQERYLEEPIDLAICDNGTVSTVKAKVSSLSLAQCKQVFADSYIRPIGEQRIYIEDIEQKERVKNIAAEEMPYSIISGKVMIRRNITLTKRDLQRILKQME